MVDPCPIDTGAQKPTRHVTTLHRETPVSTRIFRLVPIRQLYTTGWMGPWRLLDRGPGGSGKVRKVRKLIEVRQGQGGSG